MSEWRISDIPSDRYVICISSLVQVQVEWIFVGKKSKFVDADRAAETKHGIDISWVRFWHELPEIPKLVDEEWVSYDDCWFDCKEFQAPSLKYNSVEFLLFDGEMGIVQAEYWGGYQTDVVSCKYAYQKPLFWCPFPKLPIKSDRILQI